MAGTSEMFKPLEDVIRADFIRALLRREVNDLERDMLSLPARLGGMGIYKPAEECLIANTNSIYISDPLVRLIQRQVFDFDPRELADEMKALRTDIDKESDDRFKAKLNIVLAHAIRAQDRSSEKGASSWVTASPSYDHGTVLHKGEFVDACYTRYGWTLPNLPLTCAWDGISITTCARL